MTYTKILLVVALVLSSSGCTLEGKVDLESSPQLIECLDTRDGEVFLFRPAEVTDVQVDIGGDACMTLHKLIGESMRVCKAAEEYIKCKPVTQ